MIAAMVVAAWLLLGPAAGSDGSSAAAEPVPLAAARWPVAEATRARAMLDRLVGQRVGWRDGVLIIDDVGGVGRPWIGIVERRGAALWLVGAGFELRLTGPLARPRLAGVGYLIWITGARSGEAIAAQRLGVLEPRR